MKKIFFISMFMTLFYTQCTMANDPEDDDENKMKPIVSAKLSQTAIDKAAAPDGTKAVCGLLFSPQKYEATVTAPKATSKNITVSALTAGFEYAKTFKNNLFLGVQLLTDITPKKKQKGDWKSINEDLDSQVLTAGNRTAQIETDMITPAIAVKAGYWFRKKKSVAYLKVTASKMSCKYSYKIDNRDFANVDASSICFNVAVGGEYKINKKISAGLELGIPVKKKFHEKIINDNIKHKVKMSRMELRLLGVFSLSNSDAISDSLSGFGK